MVRRKSVTTLQLCWTILLVYSVSTVLTSEYKKAKKGDNVTLMCNAKKPLNWWNKNGEIIGRQKGRIQQNIYGNLIIKSVRLSDSGLYTCSSINGSVKHKSIELRISAAPSFVNVTRKVNVKKNEEVVLDCNAEGHPEPNVTMFMYKNGRIQKIANGTALNTRIPCKYCLVVFLCKAENIHGEDSVNITVDVVGKPEVNILERLVTGDTGQNVSINCATKSNPPVEYMKWLKNGKLIEPTNGKIISFKIIGIYEMLITLSFENLKEKDFGEYVCLAGNRYGNETQKVQLTSKLKKSQRKSKGKPCLSPLSASTELVISSGEIQKQTPKAKNKDANMSSVFNSSCKTFRAINLLSLFLCMSFFFSWSVILISQ